MIKELVVEKHPQAAEIQPIYRAFRPGDVRHSLADISKANRMIAYAPDVSVRQGLARATKWYIQLFS
jgi:UDP-N-acetylglucosamine 4-epimerase